MTAMLIYQIELRMLSKMRTFAAITKNGLNGKIIFINEIKKLFPNPM